MTGEISRREFIKGTVASTGFLLSPPGLASLSSLAGKGASPGDKRKTIHNSVVAVVTDYKAVDKDWRIDAHRVGSMVESLLLSLTGSSSIEEGWHRIIPGLKPLSRIAIKVNCLNPRLPSHPEVVLALAETLMKAGVEENNIIIWDRSEGNIREGLFRCGYKINTSRKGLRCLGINSPGIGYDTESLLKVPSIGKSFPVTRIVSQMSDHTINVSVLKDHSVSGATLSLKNFYGAIPLLNNLAVLDAERMHKNNANPQIAELYNNSLIRDKVRLSLCDALLGSYEGGPSGPPQWVNYQLMASLDPVALDSVGLKIIDTRRREVGLPPAAPRAGYIHAGAQLGLGTDNPEEIEIRNSILS